MASQQFLVGLDVGSTTVKAVAVDAATDAIVWSDYQRHETKQPEKTLEFLERLEADLGIWRKIERPAKLAVEPADCIRREQGGRAAAPVQVGYCEPLAKLAFDERDLR